MKSRFLTLMALLFALGGASAQELPEIVPPSPESVSIAKFTEIPVSHYTGIPNINVPIYEINFDGLKIPIGLSYHARGIKVEEIASRVGIGWALNAGGVITRQIRGKNDFLEGYLTESFYDDFITNQSTRQYVANSVSNGDIDLIPDQFSFNFLGYSGKFIFDQKTKAPVLQSYDDLRIEKVGNSDSDLYFIITTKDGFKFYFGNPETPNTSRNAKSKELITPHQLTTSVSVFPSTTEAVNTWHLIDIVSPNGKKIQFNYELEYPIFYRRSYDERKDGGSPSSYFSQITGFQYQLQEIIFDLGKVKFIKEANERQDLDDGFALSSIEVENNYRRIKKYNFNYSYSYNSSPNNVNYYLFNEEQAQKRLFLENIQEVGNNNNSQLYRAFEYTDKNALPNRFSNEQDLWGYYNGKNNGPFLTFSGYGSYHIDREVDTVKANIGLIKKISYPTGGYTSYTFEANKAIAPGYFKDLLFPDPNPTVQTRYAFLRKDMLTNVSYGLYENDFEILESDIGPITVNVSFNGNVGTCSSTVNSPSCKYRVSIVDVNGQIVTNNGIPLYLFSGPSYTIPIEMLPPGGYRIRVENVNGADDPNAFDPGFAIHLNWYQPAQSNTPPYLMYSGGNRIKEIENYSVDNGKITRSYKYLRPNGSSSGIVFSLPQYYYIESTITLQSGVQVPITDYSGARPGSPLTYEQGNHVGYSHVTEYIDSENSKGEGGKTTYQYTAIPDGGKFFKYPYTLAVNNEWLRGKPLLIEYFNRDLNSYSIVKKEEFVYKYADEFSYGVLSDPFNLRLEPEETASNFNYIKNYLKFYRPLVAYKSDQYQIEQNPVVHPDDYKIYYLVGGVQKLFKKTDTYYNSSGDISTTTEHHYDYHSHYQVEGSEITDSKGELYNTSNSYSILSNPFRVLPANTKTYKGNIELSEHNTVYNNFGSLYLPEKIQTSKGNQALEDRIIYLDYDENGNPIEVSKAGGTHIVYVWGYNREYPIAKIENATYTQVEAAANITDLQGKSNEDIDNCTAPSCKEQQLRNALEALRSHSSLQGAMVTTYTYDPLVGVTSITDPRGHTTYYEYDDFNRLEHVKDADGNLLSENKYNYKN